MSLISVEDLASRLGDQDLRVADVRWYLGEPERGPREYAAGHIPGAIFLDLDADLSATEGPGRHPLPEPRDFAERMARRGIGTDHFVVAYDATAGTVAARLWWMLDNLGHRRVAVLDGGLRTWIEAGQPLSTEPPTYPPARLELADRWTNIIDRATLRPRLGEVSLLDARASERYRGEVEPVDPVAGHIPTAVSAPSSGNLGSGGRFLAPTALAARYQSLGPDHGDVVASCGSGVTACHLALGPDHGDVVASCGSGVTACHLALAMRLAGLPDPILYPGSWSDWSSAGLPAATGASPGRLEPSPD